MARHRTYKSDNLHGLAETGCQPVFWSPDADLPHVVPEDRPFPRSIMVVEKSDSLPLIILQVSVDWGRDGDRS